MSLGTGGLLRVPIHVEIRRRIPLPRERLPFLVFPRGPDERHVMELLTLSERNGVKWGTKFGHTRTPSRSPRRSPLAQCEASCHCGVHERAFTKAGNGPWAGKATVNVDPTSNWLCTPMVPPAFSTIFLTM